MSDVLLAIRCPYRLVHTHGLCMWLSKVPLHYVVTDLRTDSTKTEVSTPLACGMSKRLEILHLPNIFIIVLINAFKGMERIYRIHRQTDGQITFEHYILNLNAFQIKIGLQSQKKKISMYTIVINLQFLPNNIGFRNSAKCISIFFF